MATWRLLSTAAVLLALGFAPQPGWTWHHDDDDDNEVPFAEAEIFFELNDTDGDLGIHALIDGDPWKWLEIEDPRERRMLAVAVRGRLGRQGLTELFFESAEPDFDELDPDVFFARFPKGEYEIEGVTLEGDELESTVELTHVLPAPPEDVTVNGVPAGPPEDEECDEEDLPEVSNAVVIEWDAVTTSHPTLGESDPDIEIIRYQVVAEWEDEDENVFVSSIDIQPDDEVDRYTVTFPPEFFVDGTEVKFEVLVREASFNQTAFESCPFEFVAEP
jgi:hypothetical protein